MMDLKKKIVHVAFERLVLYTQGVPRRLRNKVSAKAFAQEL